MGGEGGDAGEIGGGGDAEEGEEGGDADEPPEVEEQEQEQMEEEGAWPQPPMVQPPMLDLEVDGVSMWCQHTYTLYLCISFYDSFWNSWLSLIPRVEGVWLEVRIEVGMC